MKKIYAILLSLLLVSVVFTMSFEKAFADKPKDKNEKIKIKKMNSKEKETGDLNFDGIDDIYLKIVNSGIKNKPIKIDIKIKDTCVNGIQVEDAAMKIGISKNSSIITPEFFTDEFIVSNKWFDSKKTDDENHQIDLAVISSTSEFFGPNLPVSGEDMIQGNDKSKDSMKYKDTIDKIGGQSGWEGSFSITGVSGEHTMWLFLPLTEPTNEGDDCNFVSAISLPIIIP